VRAIVYSEGGDAGVMRLVERPLPEPGSDEVRVRVEVSGVNPTDWKARQGGSSFPEMVPNQDGAGVIDAVGQGVEASRVGERVWLWEAADLRADGTAQEYLALPSRHAVRLDDSLSFDLGASLGIPALTAHRCLTVADGGPDRLSPGALAGRTVLVAGGAGAVGHAAIQLAAWAGAEVIATVSGDEKGRLASAAGAHHTFNYRVGDAAERIRALVPGGVDIVVEVSPAANAELDAHVVGENAVVACYATDGGPSATLPIYGLMRPNVRYQFVLVYTVPTAAKDNAVADVARAAADGALPVGEEAGLPLQRFPLERTSDAHDAVENGAVGKVLIDVVG
jgi:NADPH2:quinone reductase